MAAFVVGSLLLPTPSYAAEAAATKKIKITINLTTDGPNDKTLGPITVTVRGTIGGSVSTIPPGCPGGPAGPIAPGVSCSNSYSDTVVSDEQPNSSNTVTLTATAIDVQPGTYQICLQGQNAACKTVVKTAGSVKAVTFDDEAEPAAYSGGADAAACGGKLGAMAWILCPIFEGINDATRWAFTVVIEPELRVKPLTPGTLAFETMFKVWSAFRDLANVFFVVIFLVIIFANTLSIGISSYAIKKMLPRLVIAAILVQFSFFITQFAIDVGNILGEGIPLLIPGDLDSAGGATGVHKAVSTLVGAGGLVLTAGIITALEFWPLLLPIVIGLAMSLLSVIFTLVFRRVLINILIILAPLAFVAWILPNTEKLFKLWWTNLVRVILMYPMIILLITMAAITKDTVQASSGMAQIIALLIPTIAFFMIPATFKAAGSLMGKVSGAVQSRTSGYKKRLEGSKWKKGLQEDRQERLSARESNRETPGFGMDKDGQFGFRKASGYVAGAAKGRIFGAKSPSNRYRYERDQAAAAETQKKQIEAANFNFGDMMAFTEGRYGDIKNPRSAALKKMQGNVLATAAVHSMMAEAGVYNSTMAARLETDTTLNDSQKDFAHAYIRSGKAGSKLRETNMVMAMANRQAFHLAADPSDPTKLKGVFTPSALDPGSLKSIRGQTESMTTDALSRQKPEGIKMLEALGTHTTTETKVDPTTGVTTTVTLNHGSKLISTQAIKGLIGNQTAANMSDEQRTSILTAVQTNGTPENQAQAEVIIHPTGRLLTDAERVALFRTTPAKHAIYAKLFNPADGKLR